MQYKAVFIDMDGTLLDSHRRISQVTKDSIIAAQKHGAMIVINSGRLPLSIEHFLANNGLEIPYIALNGAYIYDTLNNTLVFKDAMDCRGCVEMLEKCNQLRVQSYWYTKDKMYTNNFLSNSKMIRPDMKQLFFDTVMSLSGYLVKSKHLEDTIRSGKYEILKGSVTCLDASRMELLQKEFQVLGTSEVTASSTSQLEFSAKGVLKGNAMKRVLCYYGIRPDESIAIGDQENDISMIQQAGLGIAMGNAIERVKILADFVTDTNNNDGVAKALHKYIL